MPRQPTSVLGGRIVVPGGRRFHVAAITASVHVLRVDSAKVVLGPAREPPQDSSPLERFSERELAWILARSPAETLVLKPQSAAHVEEQPEPG